MHRIFYNKQIKYVTALLAVLILAFAVIVPTVAYIMTMTSPLVNTFVSGLTPEGDLIIRKTVEHPFGEGYVIPDDIEFEYYALEVVENRANDFIAQHELTPDDIKTYKIRMKKKEEFVKREIRGGKTISEKVEFMNVRIYLSYICKDNFDN